MKDNYDLWAAHDAEQEEELEQLPKCDCCGNPIQDEHLWQINGDLLCEECMNDSYRRSTDEFVI